MPGSVHCVKFRNKILTARVTKKRMGTTGVIVQISLKMKMQYGIKMPNAQM